MNVIRRGYRMISNAGALSEEETTENIRHEFSRRVRIGAGNFQAFFCCSISSIPLQKDGRGSAMCRTR